MALIDLINVSKMYDIKKILCKVNFFIEEGERVAIVGRNGSGKSTIMKIITDNIELDSGQRMIANNLEIKMLPQKPIFKDFITVRQVIEEELEEIQIAKKDFEKLSLEIAENPENKELLKEHSKLTTFLDIHNAWDLDNKIERILTEFKLKEYEDRDVNLLSGGEQRRVTLAGLILKKPDILLLDEPTNHLDVYMVEFLEEVLLKEKFTLIFISHDRYFIDNLATRTVEIDDCKLTNFKGGYTNYLQQKEQLLANMAKDHENLLRHLKAEEHWMQRGVTARRKRNQGRKERLLKLREDAKRNPSLIKKMSLELQREQKNFNGNQGDKSNKKKMLFDLKHISKSLGDKLLIEDLTIRILQRDKIAIVGKNGTGKSTLLKILLGSEKVDNGIFKVGDFKIGYFDQHKDVLDDTKSLIEVFCPNGGDRVTTYDGRDLHVYGYLKNFLFPRELLDKKIGALSGGEKSRVALALLFTKKIDCLILDEPTNDLDIPTMNILEENLRTFSGALIFVSHDRYFIDKIAQKLLIFKGAGFVEESYQTYTEYLEIDKTLKDLENLNQNITNQTKVIQKKEPQKQTKLSYKEQRDYDRLPDIIEKNELEIEKLQQCLSNPECYKEKGISAIAKELEELEEKNEEVMELFFELEEKIEMMNA